MCEPVSASTMMMGSLAMSAGQAVMGFASQSAAANQKQDYENRKAAAQEKYRQENARNANAAFIEEAAGINQQLVEKEVAEGQEVEDMQKQRLRETGSLAANSQAAGLSAQLLAADFYRQEAGYRDRSSLQMEMDQMQAQQQVKGFSAKRQSRANSVQAYIPEPVSRPSIGGAVAGFAGDAFSSYGTYQNNIK